MSNEEKMPGQDESQPKAEGELAEDELDKVSGGMVIDGGTTAIKQRTITTVVVDDDTVSGPSPHM